MIKKTNDDDDIYDDDDDDDNPVSITLEDIKKIIDIKLLLLFWWEL